MTGLTLNVQGFAAVNRDLTVEVRNPATNALIREVKPFLDGTVRVPQIDPGDYEITIKHPNLVAPVLRRPIRVLPTGDTKVSVLIDPSKFRNTPIEDIPDANLEPIAQTVQSVSETILPLSQKRPGEAIRAEDWNQMASAVRDLAQSVAELTRVVSPVGHNHPELERKIDEMQGNFGSLVETLTASMAELQRQIQAQRVRLQIDDVLTVGNIVAADKRKEFLDLADELEKAVTDTPISFNRKARNVGVLLNTKLETLIQERPDGDALAEAPAVKNLGQSADLLRQQQSTTYESEIQAQRKFDRALGGGGLSATLRK